MATPSKNDGDCGVALGKSSPGVQQGASLRRWADGSDTVDDWDDGHQGDGAGGDGAPVCRDLVTNWSHRVARHPFPVMCDVRRGPLRGRRLVHRQPLSPLPSWWAEGGDDDGARGRTAARRQPARWDHGPPARQRLVGQHAARTATALAVRAAAGVAERATFLVWNCVWQARQLAEQRRHPQHLRMKAALAELRQAAARRAYVRACRATGLALPGAAPAAATLLWYVGQGRQNKYRLPAGPPPTSVRPPGRPYNARALLWARGRFKLGGGSRPRPTGNIKCCGVGERSKQRPNPAPSALHALPRAPPWSSALVAKRRIVILFTLKPCTGPVLHLYPY